MRGYHSAHYTVGKKDVSTATILTNNGDDNSIGSFFSIMTHMSIDQATINDLKSQLEQASATDHCSVHSVTAEFIMQSSNTHFSQ